jgi:hypothetical protein
MRSDFGEARSCRTRFGGTCGRLALGLVWRPWEASLRVDERTVAKHVASGRGDALRVAQLQGGPARLLAAARVGI